MTQITDHLADIEERVASALRRSNRPARSVTIVAASKQQSVDSIRAAFAAGLRDFGESYVQEAVPKMDALRDLPITWHFIGRVQANKTRIVAERFDCVHTIDRPRVAERLNSQRPAHAPKLGVFVQMNLGGEERKAGIAAAEVPALAGLIAGLPRLALRGLMCIPPQTPAPEQARPYFVGLRQTLERLAAAGLDPDSLSMGMSQDFEIAVEEGSTCVRIGSALFGSRANRTL